MKWAFKSLSIASMSIAVLSNQIVYAQSGYQTTTWTPNGITNTKVTVGAGKGSQSSNSGFKVTYPSNGSGGGVTMADDSPSASTTCGGDIFSNGDGINMQGGSTHIAVTNWSIFQKQHPSEAQALLTAPAFVLNGHTIHSLISPCGINFTLDTAILPPETYTYTIKLVNPWNAQKGKSSLIEDKTGQNLNDQYCPLGAPVLNATKISSTEWRIANVSNSQETLNFGCAGEYLITVKSSYGTTVTIPAPEKNGKQPLYDVPPSILATINGGTGGGDGGSNPSKGKKPTNGSNNGGSGPTSPVCSGSTCISSENHGGGGVSLPPSTTTGSGQGTIVITQ